MANITLGLVSVGLILLDSLSLQSHSLPTTPDLSNSSSTSSPKLNTRGLISSEYGFLWLYTKPHVDIPEDQAFCKHTRLQQISGWERTG